MGKKETKELVVKQKEIKKKQKRNKGDPRLRNFTH